MTDEPFWKGGSSPRAWPRAFRMPWRWASEFVSMQDGVGTLRVPWREDLVGDPDTGVIAGGVVTALLDHVCGLAVQAGRETPTPTATLDLRIDYLRPAKPRSGVTAEARAYKITHSIAFVRASAYDDDPDDPVATVQAAFALVAGAPS